ncbi:hypothetical protein MAR_005273 [Mya arenaria]|uniref:Uncharacterized protein n=1 Tax=Mya arenaria TaxID=6604 RepID=A0ABY7EZ18_MYAAR|nr:hypothetical protein MAR_005273 [Mya arenaria]
MYPCCAPTHIQDNAACNGTRVSLYPGQRAITCTCSGLNQNRLIMGLETLTTTTTTTNRTEDSILAPQSYGLGLISSLFSTAGCCNFVALTCSVILAELLINKRAVPVKF